MFVGREKKGPGFGLGKFITATSAGVISFYVISKENMFNSHFYDSRFNQKGEGAGSQDCRSSCPHGEYLMDRKLPARVKGLCRLQEENGWLFTRHA